MSDPHVDYPLSPHPAMPPRSVTSVTVQISLQVRALHLLYVVQGDTSQVCLPAFQKPYRAEGLWQTTCFELFVQESGRAYREFNFSPSSQWAAYGFESYRAGSHPLVLDEPPKVSCWQEPFGLLASVWLPVRFAHDARIGVSAVIEETDGAKSYWALAHPPGKPDFHHPDCFAAELPAPGAA